MILLDADVIIDLHRLNVWNNVVAKNKIYISSIILRQEVHFYEDCNGIRHYIDLLENAGSLFQEISISAEDLKLFLNNLIEFSKENSIQVKKKL